MSTAPGLQEAEVGQWVHHRKFGVGVVQELLTLPDGGLAVFVLFTEASVGLRAIALAGGHLHAVQLKSD